MESGADVDDDTVAGLLEGLKGSATDVKDTNSVDIEHSAEAVCGELLGTRKKVTSGAVDDSVETSKVLEGLLDRPLCVLGNANVPCKRLDLQALAAHLRHGRVQKVLSPSHEHQL